MLSLYTGCRPVDGCSLPEERANKKGVLMELTVVAGVRLDTASSHPLRFYTGEVVRGNPSLALKTGLVTEQSTVIVNSPFKIINPLRYRMTQGCRDALREAARNADFVILPKKFTLVPDEDWGDLPKGSFVAYQATKETLRLPPDQKVASNVFILIH